LLTNIQLNGVSHLIETHAIALGSKPEQTLTFELSPDNSGDHRVRTDAGDGLFSESSRQTIAVRSTRFDDVIAELDPATALVWLEAQGFEGFILEGAKKAVDHRVPVMTEFCPYMVARAGAYEAFVSAALRYQKAFDLFDTRGEAFAISRLALSGLRERLGDRGAYTDLLLT
jgi:FkbM family methyltransferase